MTASANPRAAERNKRLAMDALSCSYVAQSRFINHATQERKNGLRGRRKALERLDSEKEIQAFL